MTAGSKMADVAVYVFLLLIGYVLLRVLHLSSRVTRPSVMFSSESDYIQTILNACPILQKP